MVKFEKILLPTDFSESAENAGKYAVSLAKKYGSKVHVVHVIETFTYNSDFGINYATQFGEMEATAKKYLDEIVTSIQKAGLDVEGVLLSGVPFVEIIKYAKNEQADLIVMATHGRTGVEHLLMGSVAEKVIRKSTCPVMSIKKPGQVFVMP